MSADIPEDHLAEEQPAPDTAPTATDHPADDALATETAAPETAVGCRGCASQALVHHPHLLGI